MYDMEAARIRQLNAERKCQNCISGMPIKGRERKRKCTNPTSVDFKKVINRANVCDMHEYE